MKNEFDNDAFLCNIQGQLEDVTQILSMSTPISEIENWDSLTEMLIVSMITDNYGVKINVLELKKCEKIQDIVILVKLKL